MIVFKINTYNFDKKYNNNSMINYSINMIYIFNFTQI